MKNPGIRRGFVTLSATRISLHTTETASDDFTAGRDDNE